MEIEKVDDNKDKEEMKKQGRRRLHHTNKPYKQRLMNMAEARREIATALKFHRASMNQQQQQSSSSSNHLVPPLMEQQENSNYSQMNTHHYPIPISPPPPLHHHQHHLNLVLPNQTLGLNLNFQDFNGLTTTIYHTPMPVPANENGAPNSSGYEIKSVIEIGAEKVTKAAAGCCDDEHEDEDDPFEQVMEFPAWLMNANESSCLQDLNHYSPDPALPWMDIGEIEGMDGEWLA